MAQPLLKWPGGKRWLAPKLEHLYVNGQRIVEPFAGGAAVFFHFEPAAGILGDANSDLINTYRQVQSNPDGLIAIVDKWENSEAFYYEVRSLIPTNQLEAAARFLYLTRLSFNGIYRVNLMGQFNVPYGKKTHLSSIESRSVHKASILLQNVDLCHGDFEETLGRSNGDDFIFIDPPYTVAHNQNGFVKYNSRIFSWEDQNRLSRAVREKADEGATIVVSNADHESVRQLYADFDYTQVGRFSIIGSRPEYRREVTEAVFLWGGPTNGKT